jgi:FKBP-type peptidyl-prolyl cis-trans isomerase 2
MKKETVALIALVVIVLGSLSVFVVGTNTTVFTDIFTQKPTVAIGDCVNVSYIGRFASNNTVFDSSYATWQNKTGDSPLQVFMTYDDNATAPKAGYSKTIKGFTDGLIGMQEGQTKTIGPIPPQDAYGANKLSVGDRLTTKALTASYQNLTLNQTVEVVNETTGNITLHWVNISFPDNFTLPEGLLMKDLTQAYMTIYDMLPPYYLWENSSHVVNITNDSVVVMTTPSRATNITRNVTFFNSGDQIGFVFPNATTATWTNSTVTISSNPVKGAHYVMDFQGTIINITIGNITTNHINVTAEAEGQNQSLQLNRTITFNRTYNLRRDYVLPMMYAPYIIGEDAKKAGFSMDHLAGESLIFEVTVDKIYKTAS